MHGFVFPNINMTMKPLVLHSVTSETFCKPNRYGKFSLTVSTVESWNQIQKQLKNMQLKDLSPNKIKAGASNFYIKSY